MKKLVLVLSMFVMALAFVACNNGYSVKFYQWDDANNKYAEMTDKKVDKIAKDATLKADQIPTIEGQEGGKFVIPGTAPTTKKLVSDIGDADEELTTTTKITKNLNVYFYYPVPQVTVTVNYLGADGKLATLTQKVDKDAESFALSTENKAKLVDLIIEDAIYEPKATFGTLTSGQTITATSTVEADATTIAEWGTATGTKLTAWAPSATAKISADVTVYVNYAAPADGSKWIVTVNYLKDDGLALDKVQQVVANDGVFALTAANENIVKAQITVSSVKYDVEKDTNGKVLLFKEATPGTAPGTTIADWGKTGASGTKLAAWTATTKITAATKLYVAYKTAES